MPFRTSDFLSVVLVLATAATARFGFVVVCAHRAQTAGPIQVQDPRHDLDLLVLSLHQDKGYATRLAANGTPQRQAHPSPFYPWLLAQLMHFPPGKAEPGLPLLHERVRWLQAGLGSLTAVLWLLFARWAFASRLVALLTGLLAALHPFWIVNVAELDDGTLAAFLLAACCYLGTRGGPDAALFSWGFGFTLACLALTRAAMLPFAFIALFWLLRRCQASARGGLPAFLAVVGFLSALSPWLALNYRAFHDVFPIVDTAYYHLWVGNHDDATGGPLEEPIVKPPALDDEGRHLSDAELARQVLAEVTEHPAETIERRLRAGLYFVFGAEWFRSGRFCRGGQPDDWEDSPHWLPDLHAALLAGSLLLLLPLALLGWRWSYPRRDSARLATLALIWVPLPYVLGHAEALSGPRLPLDGVLCCYAAVAISCVLVALARLRIMPSRG